jgi:hypothetical protein
MSNNNFLTITELKQFTGTSQYYKHCLYGNNFVYTDGVRYVAQQGHCYWLIDEIVFLLKQQLIKKHYSEFYSILVTVNENKSAKILATDGNDNVLAITKIEFTDLQIQGCELTLFLGIYDYDENEKPKYCLMLPSEY